MPTLSVGGSRRGRSPLRLGAAALAAAPLILLPAATAHAAPGDNGDVKVHDSATAVDKQSDDTKVCSFYLDAFSFDTVQNVTWTISQIPPTGNTQVLAGAIVLTGGIGHTDNLSLPDGHYKLDWTFQGENGTAKQKVFMVSCLPSGSPSPSSSGSTPASPSASASASKPAGGPGVTPSGGPGVTPSGGVGAGGGGSVEESSMPEVIGGAALIAGAAGAGLWALRRNRRSAH